MGRSATPAPPGEGPGLLNVRFVPGPRTLSEGIRQLPPGHRLVVEDGEAPRVESYHSWDFRADARLGFEEAAEEFLAVLRRAVGRQLVTDVDVGLFLSGGLDSSALLLAASERGASPPLSFTLGFNEPTDENADAAAVAAHLGARHRDTRLQPRPLGAVPPGGALCRGTEGERHPGVSSGRLRAPPRQRRALIRRGRTCRG